MIPHKAHYLQWQNGLILVSPKERFNHEAVQEAALLCAVPVSKTGIRTKNEQQHTECQAVNHLLK